MVYGFNEDHVSILSSEQVISQYNAILAETYQKPKKTNQVPGNRLQVDFSFDFPEGRPRPMPYLLLRSANKKGAETWLQLSHEDSGKEHGPFPSGNYEVSMLAPAFAPEPVSIPIRIEAGRIPKVEFALQPVGYIRGYIVKKEPNIQAGKDRQPDAELKLESISLKGNGIDRTLIQLKSCSSSS